MALYLHLELATHIQSATDTQFTHGECSYLRPLMQSGKCIYATPIQKDTHKQPQQTEMSVTQPPKYRKSHVGYQREHLSHREMVVEMVEIATCTEFNTYTQIPPPLAHAVPQRRQSHRATVTHR